MRELTGAKNIGSTLQVKVGSKRRGEKGRMMRVERSKESVQGCKGESAGKGTDSRIKKVANSTD